VADYPIALHATAGTMRTKERRSRWGENRQKRLSNRDGFGLTASGRHRIARRKLLGSGGESHDVWKVGPLCVKRWSPRVSPAQVRLRCRASREIPVCNRMWYVPWLHWTVARWVVGVAATHQACNRLLARFPSLRDLHSGNVISGWRGVVGVVVVEGLPLGASLRHLPSNRLTLIRKSGRLSD
jgi:hypothetical protein